MKQTELLNLAYETGYINAADKTDLSLPKPSSIALEAEMKHMYMLGIYDARGGGYWKRNPRAAAARTSTAERTEPFSIHPLPRKPETIARKRRQHIENQQRRAETQRSKKIWPGIGLHANARDAAKNEK